MGDERVHVFDQLLLHIDTNGDNDSCGLVQVQEYFFPLLVIKLGNAAISQHITNHGFA